VRSAELQSGNWFIVSRYCPFAQNIFEWWIQITVKTKISSHCAPPRNYGLIATRRRNTSLHVNCTYLHATCVIRIADISNTVPVSFFLSFVWWSFKPSSTLLKLHYFNFSNSSQTSPTWVKLEFFRVSKKLNLICLSQVRLSLTRVGPKSLDKQTFGQPYLLVNLLLFEIAPVDGRRISPHSKRGSSCLEECRRFWIIPRDRY
jgi:hypothetical protein